jgi:hypothetical protein
MAKVWEKLGGTSETTFQIGLGGPKVKNASGVLEARNAADGAYVVMRGADPSGVNDLVTKGYTGSISATAADSAQFAGKADTWFVYGAPGNATNQAASVEDLLELAHYKSGHWDASNAAWLPDLGWWWGLTTAHRSNGPAYNFGGQITFQNGGGGDNVYARTIAGGPTPSASAWSKLLSSGNFNSYAPTLIGGGASGTWGINVTGSAGSAGSATYAGAVTIVDDVSTNAVMYPMWVTSNTGNLAPKVSSTLWQFNPGAQIFGYGGRQFQLSNFESTYKWKFGGGVATGWYKIADITIGLGLYSGASFEIDFLDVMGNFGNSALSEPYRFYVSCTRSGGVQDDMDWAVVSGPKTEYLRVVKTAIGAFELQVTQPYDWRHHEVTCHCTVKNVAVVTYANSPGAGSAPGTAYTATSLHYHRFTNVDVRGQMSIGGLAPHGLLDIDGGGGATTWIYFANNVNAVAPSAAHVGTFFGWNFSGGEGESVIAYRTDESAGTAPRLALGSFTGGAFTETLTIKAGKVGVRTADPSSPFDIEVLGTVTADVDFLELTNTANAASMTDTRTSILWNQWYYDASTPAVADAAKITVGTVGNWTSTSRDQNSYLSICTVASGNMREALRAEGADVRILGAFGCNGEAAQPRYTFGGACPTNVGGSYGLDTAQHMSDLAQCVLDMRAALWANGIMTE